VNDVAGNVLELVVGIEWLITPPPFAQAQSHHVRSERI
jgi:hypothetical protein